jgi:ABC-type transport system involved in multi-copper enzyme maturation permease subunit
MNKLHTWKALARGVILESIRRKDLWVVAILGFLIIAAAGTLGVFGFDGLQTFAKDLSATVLGLFSTIVAILTSTRLVPEEVKNRTLYPLLSRPISRFDFLFGKLIGAIAVTWISFLLLAVLSVIALSFFRVGFEPVMGQYLIAKMMGLALICSVGLALSCYLTPAAAATMGFILAFGSGVISRAFTMAYENASPGSQAFFKVINGILPQYGLFDLGSRVANTGWGPVPIWVIGALAAYTIAYSTGMLTLGWMKFRKQAV